MQHRDSSTDQGCSVHLVIPVGVTGGVTSSSSSKAAVMRQLPRMSRPKELVLR